MAQASMYNGGDLAYPNCSVDGAQITCGLVSSEAAAQCPNNQCSGFNGQGKFFQITASATGAVYANNLSAAPELNCVGESTDNYQCQWSRWSSWLVADGNQTKYFGNIANLFQAHAGLWNNTAVAGNALGAATAGAIALPFAAGAAASVSWVDIGIGPTANVPNFFHFVYGVDGAFQQGLEVEGAMQLRGGAFAARTFMQTPLKVSLPVLFPDAVLGTEGAAVGNCFTACVSAIVRGWIP
jgi:hypothetical protein